MIIYSTDQIVLLKYEENKNLSSLKLYVRPSVVAWTSLRRIQGSCNEGIVDILY